MMNTKYLISFFIKIFIFFTFLFARTFMGLHYYSIRLGEILIVASTLVLILYTLVIPIITKRYFLDNKRLNFLLIALYFSFYLMNIFDGVNLLNPQIYKVSSYIWSFGALVFGYEFISKIGFKIYNHDIYLSFIGLLIIYIFSTKGISENLQNILLNHTDKFEYPKGSDLLIAFIFVFYIFLENKQYSKNSFIILIFMTALYVPLFLVKSRSGFISLVIFLLLAIPKFKKTDFKLDLKLFFSLVLGIIIFLVSTSWVVSRNIVVDEDISQELKFAVTSRYSTINDNKYEDEVLKLNLFYFEDGRIFSLDGNLNWRMQIWQDISDDMNKTNILFKGYGFSDLIPAMDSDQRGGQDNQNVNVHNYFIHILSRGGLIHLFIVWGIFYYLFKSFKMNDQTIDYKIIVIPLIFNSLFDPSMENAHYSIILYFLTGLALKKSIILDEGV